MASILDRFTIYNPLKHGGKIFVSVTSYGITFSTNTVKILNAPVAVSVYFDSKNKKMAIKPDKHGEQKFLPNKGESYVRWNDKRLMQAMKDAAGKEITGNRFTGKYFDDENIVIFDFEKVKPIRKTK